MFQKAKTSMETKQGDGSRRLVNGAYVDFMSGPRCMMRDESSEGCRRGVRLTVGIGEAPVPSIKSLC